MTAENLVLALLAFTLFITAAYLINDWMNKDTATAALDQAFGYGMLLLWKK